jgi:hypothetical protein
MSYMDTIIEGRSPTRRALPVAIGIAELKKWTAVCNVYRSIYSFERLTSEGSPDWASAVLPCICLDVDVLNARGEIHDPDLIAKIVEWARKEDYEREYVFTGGGFNVFVFVENATKERLYQAHYFLRNDLKFNLDKAAIDIARGTRFVPSYNFNKKAFVGYVSEEECLMPFKNLHDSFQRPRKGRPPRPGTSKWNLAGIESSYASHVMVDPGVIDESRGSLDFQEIEKKYGKVCDTIIGLGNTKHVAHQERFFVILYIKDVLKVPYEDFTPVYKSLMRCNGDYAHSTRVEQQPRYAYGRGTRFNPTAFKKFGYCPRECHECEERMKEDDETTRCMFL